MSAEGWPTSIADAGAGFRSGAFSVEALTRHFLKGIRRLQPELNALITVTEDLAVATAATLDAELGNGIDRGALHGVPIVIKDDTDVAGYPTTVGSALYKAPGTARGGRCHPRQGQHERIRRRRQRRLQPPFWEYAKSLVASPRTRRLIERHGRCGGSPALPGRDGHRCRRLRARAGVAMRCRRRPADLWAGQLPRDVSTMPELRNGRADRKPGRRCRRIADGDGRPRSRRPELA